MSILLTHRSSKAKLSLPSGEVSVLVPSVLVPQVNSLSEAAHLDADTRAFYKVAPRVWRRRQTTQCALFFFGLSNLYIAVYAIQKIPKSFVPFHLDIESSSSKHSIDLISAAALLFAFDGFIFCTLSLFFYSSFIQLVEREVNPFRYVDSVCTNLTIILSYSFAFGLESALHAFTLSFLCCLTPLLNLVTEHCVYYTKMLTTLGARTAPNAELLFPYVLALGSLSLSLLTPLFLSLHQSTETVSALRTAACTRSLVGVTATYMLQQFVVGTWIVSPKFTYIRSECAYQLTLFAIRVQFLRGVASTVGAVAITNSAAQAV